jgi:hypothetical protein
MELKDAIRQSSSMPLFNKGVNFSPKNLCDFPKVTKLTNSDFFTAEPRF